METVWDAVEDKWRHWATKDDQNVRRAYREIGVNGKILRMGAEWCVFRTDWSEDLRGLYCRRLDDACWLVWVCDYTGRLTWSREGASLRMLLIAGRQAANAGRKRQNRTRH